MTGGPAFPLHWKAAISGPVTDMSGRDISSGMSLRDYFAGQIIAKFTNESAHMNPWWDGGERAAESAYRVADAMLKAREAKS